LPIRIWEETVEIVIPAALVRDVVRDILEHQSPRQISQSARIDVDALLNERAVFDSEGGFRYE